MNTIAPNEIESISVIKGKDALGMYGAKGKNGVIFITKKPVQSNMVTMTKRQAIDSNQISFTDKNNNSSVKPFISKSTETDSIPDKVFTKVENKQNSLVADKPGQNI